MLLDKYPLVLDRKLATIIGLNEALVLQQIHYWLEINKKDNRNYHEGRYWTYNTITEWQEQFPFWSENTVRRTLKRLREMGYIIVDNFNRYQMDRTLWYTIDYEKVKRLTIREDKNNNPMDKDNMDKFIEPNRTDGDTQNDKMEDGILDKAIPEITTETNITENSLDISNQSICQSRKMTIRDKEKTDRQTIYKSNFKENYERIIEKCDLYAIDYKYRDAVAHAIKLLLLDTENSKRIKIGDNLVPVQMVKREITKLDFFIIEHAVNKFKEAAGRFEIRNTIAYLKACIFNSINEYQIDIDSQLRASGVI